MEFESTTLLFLYSTDNRPVLPEAEAAKIQQAHLDHQNGLAQQGYVLTAGPFGDQSDPRLRGLSVLSVDPNRALELYGNDPAVKAGLLRCEAVTWYRMKGSAAFVSTASLT